MCISSHNGCSLYAYIFVYILNVYIYKYIQMYACLLSNVITLYIKRYHIYIYTYLFCMYIKQCHYDVYNVLCMYLRCILRCILHAYIYIRIYCACTQSNAITLAIPIEIHWFCSDSVSLIQWVSVSLIQCVYLSQNDQYNLVIAMLAKWHLSIGYLDKDCSWSLSE